MGDNDAETFANITRADYDLEDEAFDAISNNAKDFISGLLIKRKEYVFYIALSYFKKYLTGSNKFKSLFISIYFFDIDYACQLQSV